MGNQLCRQYGNQYLQTDRNDSHASAHSIRSNALQRVHRHNQRLREEESKIVVIPSSPIENKHNAKLDGALNPTFHASHEALNAHTKAQKSTSL